MTDAYSELLVIRTKHGTSELDRAIKQYNRSRLAVDMPEKRKPIPREWKLEAYARQGGNCKRCGEHFEFQQMHGDHIHALAQGGKNAAWNIAMLCAKCNLEKGSSSLVTESKRGHGTMVDQLGGEI